MIIKIERSKIARASLVYNEKKGEAKVFSEPMYCSFGIDGRIQQVQYFKRLEGECTKENVSDKYLSLSMSFNLNDKLDKAEVLALSRIALKRLFGDDISYTLHIHTDKEHLHTHALLSRVKSDGSLISNQNSWYRAKEVSRGMENEFNLIPTTDKKSEKRKSAKIAHAEIYGYDNEIRKIWKILDSAREQSKTLQQFIRLVEANGLDVKLWPNNSDPKGISYAKKLDKPISSYNKTKAGLINTTDSLKFVIRGSKLGHAYTINGLNETLKKNEAIRGQKEMDMKIILTQKIEALVKQSKDLFVLDQLFDFNKIKPDIEDKKNISFSDCNNTSQVFLSELNLQSVARFLRMMAEAEEVIKSATERKSISKNQAKIVVKKAEINIDLDNHEISL